MRWMKDLLDFYNDYKVFAVPCTLSVYATYRLVKRHNRKSAIASRGAAAASARQQAESHLESVDASTFLTPDGRQITDLSLEELQEQIRTGQLTARQVSQAFMLKALKVSHDINCVTEPLKIEDVERTAALLDSKFKDDAYREQPGLLHGLPVSLKENIQVAGMISTMGLVSHASDVSGEDAVLVQVLRSQGAIPYVKTNLPQTMVSFDCSNPLYGVTRHPLNHSRTPGGSSGGEGALLAAGGSLLGIGSDIGGSGRLPAAFCGVCGFKPTQGRLSGIGMKTILRGQSGVALSACPMARDVSGIQLLMKALCCEEMFKRDPLVVPYPMNEKAMTDKRRLRIGYFKSAPYFEATPANQRAVLQSRDALRRMGHEVVEMAAPDLYEVMSLYYSLILADGMETLISAMEGDDIDPSVKYGFMLYSIPSVVRRLAASIIYYAAPRMYSLLGNFRKRPVKELWTLQWKRRQMTLAFLKSLGDDKLDGFICPLHPIGALPIGTCARLTASASYTAMGNLFDLAAGTVPVTAVTEEDEQRMADYPHSDIWGRDTKKLAKGMVGMPIGVQCCTPTWHDEDCLYLMKELEDGLKLDG